VYALQINGLHTHPTEFFNWRIFSFAIITTLGLQILSNDYGDGIKGTDNEDRVGPKERFKVA
jgi:1,4-dihydroxy-2-naphthoate octaprenyltransferase